MVHGPVLFWWWYDRVHGPRVSSRGNQCSHHTLHNGRTHGQCWKIRYYDLPSRGVFTGTSELAFSCSLRGEGATYQERLRRRIPLPDWRVEVTAGHMTAHLRQLHGTETLIDWDWLTLIQTENLPLVYEARFLFTMQLCQFPFPGCNGTSWSMSGLKNHFSRLHWGDSILIRK